MTDYTLIDKLRQPKIAGMSILDWLVSLVAVFLIGRLFGLKSVFYWLLFILSWIVFGIFVHWYFGISTMLGYYLGINEKPIRKECY